MPFIIAQECTKDEKCIEICPAGCIHPRMDEGTFAGDGQLYIDQANCVDCGACVQVCPTNSIYPESELPKELVAATSADAEYCQ